MLSSNGRGDRITSRLEDTSKPVTSVFENASTTGLNGLVHGTVMSLQRRRHGIGVLIPKTRRTLNICKQEVKSPH